MGIVNKFISVKPVEDMNIHEKRKYAKYIGVKSPTVLTLGQLDEAIRLKELEIGSLKEMIGIYDMPLAARVSLESMNSAQSRVTKSQSGYFFPFAEGDGVLRYETFRRLYERDIYVPKSMVDECGLKTGDFVSCDIMTIVYNKINIVKTMRHVNDKPYKGVMQSDDFALMQRSAPQKRLRLLSNNPYINLSERLLRVGEGQTLSLSVDDDSLLKKTAYDLLVALYRAYDGKIYSLYNPSLEPELKTLYNPFTCTDDRTEDNFEMLTGRLKRHMENGENAAVVAYTTNIRMLDVLQSLAGKYVRSALTVLVCGHYEKADGMLTVTGGKVVSERCTNKYLLPLAGEEMLKKLLGVSAGLSGETPESAITKLNAAIEE